MRARENKCQISQDDILQFAKFYLCFEIFVKFDVYFLGLPWEIVLGVITDN